MLGRLGSLGVAKSLLGTLDSRVGVFGAFLSSEAAGDLTERVASLQPPSPTKQGGNGELQKRRKPGSTPRQNLRQRRMPDQHSKAGSPAGKRGSKESEAVGRYLNTWPVAISHTPRTAVAADIIHFLTPMGLHATDIRPEYDPDMRLVQFWIALHKPRHQEAALALDGQPLGTGTVRVKTGTPAEMETALNRRFASSSRGRYVMMTGLTMKATIDDVMRLFQNFDMLPASVSMLMTGLGKRHRRAQLSLNPNAQQVAVVRFETFEEANRAFRTCNFGFVRNELIKLRIII